jgi:glycosyltransferase involved in cell wall biosynthesis
MRVGLNLVWMTPGTHGGLEVYARELTAALAKRDDVELTLFMNPRAAEADWDGAGEPVIVPVNPERRVEWVRGEQQLLPIAAQRAGVDLVHSLATTAPAWGGFRRVVSVHDLSYIRTPDSHFGVRNLGMRVLGPLAVRRSHRVLASSRSTRDDVVDRLRADPRKVDVVPLGIGQLLPSGDISASELRRRLELGERPVALSVSAKRPHKNLARLIAAIARIPAERRPILVLPGYPTPYEPTLRARASELGVEDDVRFLGWVSEAELDALYAAAACFVFPSLYEGFGFPVLEAMVRGVPVATSGRASLAEVAGDAALLFDPESEHSIADAVSRLLEDRELAASLVAAGRKQAAQFSWGRTAEATVESYRRLMAESTGAPRRSASAL